MSVLRSFVESGRYNTAKAENVLGKFRFALAERPTMTPKDFLPPTDNLYKFVSLSGVILVLTCLVILGVRGKQVEDDIFESESQSVSLQSLIERNEAQLPRLHEQITTLRKDVDDGIAKVKVGSTNREEEMELALVASRLEGRVDDLKERMRLSDDLVTSIAEKKDDLKSRSRMNRSRFNALGTLIVLLAPFLMSGVVMAYYGFRSWRKHLQDPQDQLLKLKLEYAKKKYKSLTAGLPSEKVTVTPILEKSERPQLETAKA